MGLEILKIGNTNVTNYSDYFVLNELVYSQEPQRYNNGELEDLSKIDSFIVTRIFVDFKYLDIVKYRELLQALSVKEFPITYYDPDYNTTETKLFYLKPLSRSKLYVKPTSDGVEAKGVRDLSLEFVATLRDNVQS